MSKDNKQYKQYEIKDIEHACSVLSSLIISVEIDLEKYKEYYLEAVELMTNSQTDVIPAKKYEDVKDKILYRQHELLKFIADYQNSSFSYIYLRKILLKNGFLANELDEDINALLNEFLNIRNWTFHNPQSMLVAKDEVTSRIVPKEHREFIQIKPQINPIIIEEIVGYRIEKLVSFVCHLERRIQQFETVLSCMKKDYQELYDSLEVKPIMIPMNDDIFKVQYVRRQVISGLDTIDGDIAQISMAIQKSKYDGSEEKFHEWVVRRKK